jgi:hypothetical protein
MGPHPARALIAALLLLAHPVAAQQPGWTYSPLPGEGDRAAMGCSLRATAQLHACVAVRCEDDFSVGIHIQTSRPQGDVGAWAITIDKETRPFAAEASGPYGARIAGDVSWLRHNLAHGAIAYLEPLDGLGVPDNHIALDGSLYAINLALAYCAPRVRVEPIPEPGV